MASTFTDLGLELMATGENAGTWGDKTNANLNLIQQLTGGVLQVAIGGGAGTTTLDIDNGALTGTAQQRVLEFTGTISGNRIVTWPLLTENFYIVKNGTSGAHTVQLKAASGSGATVTFSDGDKGYKLIYLDGVATNTGLFEVPFSNFGQPLDWITKTGSYTAINQDRIFVDTSGGAVTITLPASPAVGDQVNFVDSRYTFDTNALTVGRNSSKITNATADLVVNTEGAAFGLVFSGSNVGWTYTEK